ncbi:polysaccharide pyruvyl transferase family protein [Indioceanicola profundi]|uniref:polysaccharide pyruvyl transferase family protein n=1 Tax=Indioceanicola profundi TaxID=2220096 RepID=UPI000E6A971D|nr:polysaccharide pyruvyl transferase family protein [Indioceanicola profundi]
MPPVIGISGSYGGLNLGDEAILSSAIQQLRAACPGVEIVVFSRNAEHTRRHHDVDRALNARTSMRQQILPEVQRLNLLLLGGGGILYDTEAQAYLREVELAHELGIPTFAFAVGIGPLKDRDERIAVRNGLNRMAGITVREVTAKRLCEDIGVQVPVEVTADPALLLRPEPFTDEMLAAEGIPTDRPLVGISVRERGAAAPGLTASDYHDLVADVADFMIQRFDAEPVFVPMERVDRNESHRVISRMAHPDRAYVLKRDYRPQQIMGLAQRLELVAGMRLHFLIFAAVTGTPLIALPYASKVQDLVSSLGIEHMPVETAKAGAFLARLDRLWDTRKDQKAVIAERLGQVQQLARRTVPLALATIGHGPGANSIQVQRVGEDLANPPVAF